MKETCADSISIRLATVADAKGILAAHQSSIREVASRDHNSEQVSAWSDHLTGEGYVRAMVNGETMFVATEQGNIVGFSSVKGNSVRAVYVAGSHITKGIGKRLYLAAEEFARARGEQKLYLQASKTALEFYQHMGFVLRKEGSYRFKAGAEVPCYFMDKDL